MQNPTTLVLSAFLLLALSVAAPTAEAGSLTIPAWIFDRGNARVYENPDMYADYRDSYPELVAARTERLKAKSDLLHKLIELEMAHVKVKGALGILGEECAGAAPNNGRCPE